MRYDIVIVGGGIVGLATAQAILARNPRIRLLLIEKDPARRITSQGTTAASFIPASTTLRAA